MPGNRHVLKTGGFMRKLLVVDGNGMLFRAYYATAYGHAMTSSKGIPTNAVFGFANMMQKAIDLIGPDAVLVAFDAGKHTFRHELYADYKGGRRETPEDLVPQFGLARDYLDAYHIKWVECPDIEADDLIGTMSRNSEGYHTTILTSDHDMLQLIDADTTVMLMKKGITDMEEMTPEGLKEQMGIVPLQIIDMKGLMGDHSDNIPGIPGVGEKTALKLLNEYGTVENVLENAAGIKGALGKKIQAGRESALLSKKLATIRTDVPLDFTVDECTFRPDYGALIRYFESLDMKSMIRRYEDLMAAEGVQETPACAVTFEAVKKCPKEMLNGRTAVYVNAGREPFYLAEALGIALSDGNRAVYMTLEDAENDAELNDYLANAEIIGFDIKRNIHIISRTGLKINFAEDAMILASLADSTLTGIDRIFDAYGLTTSSKYEDVFGTPARPKLPDAAEEARFCCESCMNIMKLYLEADAKVKEYGMENLYRSMELPLTYILREMEDEGVRCDAGVLAAISADMKVKIDDLQAKIYEEAGLSFNINSPKQLAEVLYDRLELPSGKKRSTSADVLEKLQGFHPIIEHLLSYRKLQKIYSTYAEGLQKYICRDGKIHTLYNQCVTQTGRLSSSEPNLQNISVRDEQGKMIRKAFKPEQDHVLLSSDYHQIELRMLASMADEKSMIDAFVSGIDIHTKTAMDIFGVDNPEDVTGQERRRAKTVNFGIVYGISDFGLAEQLGISRREAAEFIETYYEKYPGIRTYMESIVKGCEEKGYVTTLCGRRRDIPQIHDKNRMIREFGKRAAMNAPIQGSAADLIKIAMIDIDRVMKEKKVKSRMILQVHDELIFDVPKDEVDLMKQIVEEGMVNAMKLKVPLTVECSVGSDWYEAK